MSSYYDHHRAHSPDSSLFQLSYLHRPHSPDSNFFQQQSNIDEHAGYSSPEHFGDATTDSSAALADYHHHEHSMDRYDPVAASAFPATVAVAVDMSSRHAAPLTVPAFVSASRAPPPEPPAAPLVEQEMLVATDEPAASADSEQQPVAGVRSRKKRVRGDAGAQQVAASALQELQHRSEEERLMHPAAHTIPAPADEVQAEVAAAAPTCDMLVLGREIALVAVDVTAAAQRARFCLKDGVPFGVVKGHMSAELAKLLAKMQTYLDVTARTRGGAQLDPSAPKSLLSLARSQVAPPEADAVRLAAPYHTLYVSLQQTLLAARSIAECAERDMPDDGFHNFLLLLHTKAEALPPLLRDCVPSYLDALVSVSELWKRRERLEAHASVTPASLGTSIFSVAADLSAPLALTDEALANTLYSHALAFALDITRTKLRLPRYAVDLTRAFARAQGYDAYVYVAYRAMPSLGLFFPQDFFDSAVLPLVDMVDTQLAPATRIVHQLQVVRHRPSVVHSLENGGSVSMDLVYAFLEALPLVVCGGGGVGAAGWPASVLNASQTPHLFVAPHSPTLATLTGADVARTVLVDAWEKSWLAATPAHVLANCPIETIPLQVYLL